MTKNISNNFGGIKNFAGKVAKNLGWVFFAFFLLLLVFEFLEVENSFSIILNVNQPPPVAGLEKGVRINFDNYDKATQRIQQAATFQPTGGITKNPFEAQVVQQPTP